MRPTRQVLYINVLFTLGQYCLCPFPSPRVSLPYIYIQGRSIDQKEERLGNKSVNKVALYRSLSFFFFFHLPLSVENIDRWRLLFPYTRYEYIYINAFEILFNR